MINKILISISLFATLLMLSACNLITIVPGDNGTTQCKMPLCDGARPIAGSFDNYGCQLYTCEPVSCKMTICADGATPTPSGKIDSMGCEINVCPPVACKTPVCPAGEILTETQVQDPLGCKTYTCNTPTCQKPICADGATPNNTQVKDPSGCFVYSCPSTKCQIPSCPNGATPILTDNIQSTGGCRAYTCPIVECPQVLCDPATTTTVIGTNGCPTCKIINTTDPKQICIQAQGTWLAEYNECENIGDATCERMNGVFNDCASACRHNIGTSSTICTNQCVPVCTVPMITNVTKRFSCATAQNSDTLCSTVVDPVCGWFKSNIQCYEYPCAMDASNGCAACQNQDVDYYTSGKCPNNPMTG